jgi:hypothetical protein
MFVLTCIFISSIFILKHTCFLPFRNLKSTHLSILIFYHQFCREDLPALGSIVICKTKNLCAFLGCLFLQAFLFMYQGLNAEPISWSLTDLPHFKSEIVQYRMPHPGIKCLTDSPKTFLCFFLRLEESNKTSFDVVAVKKKERKTSIMRWRTDYLD